MERLLVVPDVAASFAEHVRVSQKSINQTLQSLRGRWRRGKNCCSHQARALALSLASNKKINKVEKRRKHIQTVRADPFIKRAVDVVRKCSKSGKCHYLQWMLQSNLSHGRQQCNCALLLGVHIALRCQFQHSPLSPLFLQPWIAPGTILAGSPGWEAATAPCSEAVPAVHVGQPLDQMQIQHAWMPSFAAPLLLQHPKKIKQVPGLIHGLTGKQIENEAAAHRRGIKRKPHIILEGHLTQVYPVLGSTTQIFHDTYFAISMRSEMLLNLLEDCLLWSQPLSLRT